MKTNMSIPRMDIHGNELNDRDIVAEGKRGDIIWDGQARIVKRPLGLVIINRSPDLTNLISPEETDFYNLTEIRVGLVELTEKANEFLWKNADSHGFLPLHLSRYDGRFYNWDKIEVVGNVDDFPF